MKKIVCAILTLVLLLSLTLPVLADGITVFPGVQLRFTDDSGFEPGDPVIVDVGKTMDDPDITADVWNALLEGRVTYSWYRNDSFYGKGRSITLQESDRGCEFYCEGTLYEDMDRTRPFGVIFSSEFFVENSGNPALIPSITTESLPEGTVGKDYYAKLECSESDVTYSLYRSSLPDGLYLTQHGEIEGIPTKAGSYYVVIMVTPVELGEDYAGTAEFELIITDDYCELEIMREPNKMHYKYGETLDLTGMWVRIYTSDGYIDSYDGEYLTYPTNPLVTPGDRKISVTYKDAIAIFLIVVDPAPEDPTEPPTEATEAPTEEVTEPTEAVTDPTQEAPPEATEDSSVTTGATENPAVDIPPETLDGPGSEGVDGSDNQMVMWVCVGVICFVVVVAAAVVVILVLTKRKKAA